MARGQGGYASKACQPCYKRSLELRNLSFVSLPFGTKGKAQSFV